MAMTAAIIGGAAIAGGMVMEGVAAGKQAGAARRAAEIQGASQGRLLDLMEREYEEAAPFRDISLRYARTGEAALPRLVAFTERPTASAGFRLASEEGLRRIQQDFATQGSPESGPAQVAAGRFMTGLSAAESDRWLQTLKEIAGFGTAAGPQAAAASGRATQLGGMAADQSNAIAQSVMAGGQAQAGLYGNVGQSLGSLGLLGLAKAGAFKNLF